MLMLQLLRGCILQRALHAPTLSEPTLSTHDNSVRDFHFEVQNIVLVIPRLVE